MTPRDELRREGDAHVLLGRFAEAVPCYLRADDGAALERLLELSLAFGRWRAVQALRAAGFEPSAGDYERFLRERALQQVPIGGDATSGFWIDETVARAVASELGATWPAVLADTARRMLDGGSRHVAKLYVFASLSRDAELLARVQPEIDARRAEPRSALVARVEELLRTRGGRVASVMQEPDADDYDPKVAGIFAAEVGGDRAIVKEHLRLHVDYARIDGYSEEGELLSELAHPGLARLRDTVRAGRHELLVMDVAPGSTLDGATALERRDAMTICAQIAAVLQHFHARRVVCFDVKPRNVLWDGRRATLVDLGVARRLGGSDGSGGSGGRDRDSVTLLPSSPECVPPEIARSFRAGAPADVYQLGLLAARLLTGRHPFAQRGAPLPRVDDREGELLAYALPALSCEPDLADPRIDARARATLASMLERDPARRPLVDDARAFFESEAA